MGKVTSPHARYQRRRDRGLVCWIGLRGVKMDRAKAQGRKVRKEIKRRFKMIDLKNYVKMVLLMLAMVLMLGLVGVVSAADDARLCSDDRVSYEPIGLPFRGTVSCDQMVAWLDEAGVPSAEWDAWLWISWHESRWSPDALGYDGAYGVSQGLMQISSQWDSYSVCGSDVVFDPIQNITCAMFIRDAWADYSGQSGWQMWATYNVRERYTDFDARFFAYD